MRDAAGLTDWSWKLLLAIAGPIGLAVVLWAWRHLVVRFHVYQVRPFDDRTPLRVVVSPLHNDEQWRQTQHVVDALVEHLGSGKPGGACDHVLLKGAVQRTRFGKQSFERKAVAARIQAYLQMLNADMMIWRHVAGADKCCT